MSIQGHYPLVIIQDRYSGTYSGGDWLAVADASEFVDDGSTRAQFCLTGIGGPSDSDRAAAEFWSQPPGWIAVGATPDDALKALNGQLAATL